MKTVIDLKEIKQAVLKAIEINRDSGVDLTGTKESDIRIWKVEYNINDEHDGIGYDRIGFSIYGNAYTDYWVIIDNWNTDSITFAEIEEV